MLEVLTQTGSVPLLPDDYSLTRRMSGQDSIRFTLSRQDPAVLLLTERARVRETTGGQIFLVSALDAGQKTVTCALKKDLSDWEKTVLLGYTNGAQGATLADTLSGVLPAGWSLREAESGPLVAKAELEGPTPLGVTEFCMELYGCGYVFDNGAKTLTVHLPDRKSLGSAFLLETANLRAAPEYKSQAGGLVTRLYARGAEDITFADIHDGKPYVECFDFTDEVIAGYWRDERYTIPEHLLLAARKKVKALSQPERSWSLQAADLYAVDGRSWPGLKMELFDVVKLVDPTLGHSLEVQITEMTVYPHHPERNELVVSARAGSSRTLSSALRAIRDLEARR